MSLGIYSILSYVALIGYELNKLVGVILFFSITFLSPNMYPELEGQLFPVTYVIFALFLTYYFGVEMYKKWKKIVCNEFKDEYKKKNYNYVYNRT